MALKDKMLKALAVRPNPMGALPSCKSCSCLMLLTTRRTNLHNKFNPRHVFVPTVAYYSSASTLSSHVDALVSPLPLLYSGNIESILLQNTNHVNRHRCCIHNVSWQTNMKSVYVRNYSSSSISANDGTNKEKIRRLEHETKQVIASLEAGDSSSHVDKVLHQWMAFTSADKHKQGHPTGAGPKAARLAHGHPLDQLEKSALVCLKIRHYGMVLNT